MKVFKTGDIVKAKDLNDNFNEKVNTNLSNLPAIPVNKGGTGRTNGTVSYADRAGTAEVAKKLESDNSQGAVGLIDFANICYVSGRLIDEKWLTNTYGFYDDDPIFLYRIYDFTAPAHGKKWLFLTESEYNIARISFRILNAGETTRIYIGTRANVNVLAIAIK